MKSSSTKIVLAVAAVAALALASPVNKGKAKSGLLPWFPPSADSARCGGPVGYLDRLCGTERYCNAFDGAWNRTDWKFKSTKECFQGHDRNLRPEAVADGSMPWLEPDPTLDSCARRDILMWRTDEACGTQLYCEAFATVAMTMTDKRFTSKEECFAKHAASPSATETALLPWTEGSDEDGRCGTALWLEETCGTQRYCDAFSLEPEFTDGRFGGTEECYAAHERPEKGYLAKSMLMRWKEPEPGAETVCDAWFYHMGCGTEYYCSGYDRNFNETDARFESTERCLAAFEKPAEGNKAAEVSKPEEVSRPKEVTLPEEVTMPEEVTLPDELPGREELPRPKAAPRLEEGWVLVDKKTPSMKNGV